MVSIIIPTFNSSGTLLETLESLEIQDQLLEILIIDNFSKDDTLIIAEKFKLSSKHATKILLNKLINASSSRNIGIKNATGDSILFLDSDDLLTPDAVKVLESNITNYGIVFGGWEDFNSEMPEERRIMTYQGYEKEDVMTKYFRFKPTISTALIRKNILVNFREDMAIWEVSQFFLDVILNGAKPLFISNVVTRIRQHTNPERVSIKHDHFNPIKTIKFLVKNKLHLKQLNQLNSNTEIVIDKEITDYCYQEIKINGSNEQLKQLFENVNLNLMAENYKGKTFGIYWFILFLKGIKGLVYFCFINKLLNRI